MNTVGQSVDIRRLTNVGTYRTNDRLVEGVAPCAIQLTTCKLPGVIGLADRAGWVHGFAATGPVTRIRN